MTKAMNSKLKRLVSVAIFISCVHQYSSASIAFSGTVSLNREKGPPISGVQISSPGANMTLTGVDGQFTLSYPAGRPGQEISLRAAKDSMEVVNSIMLDQRLSDGTSAKPFEIILCSSANLEARKAEFYRLKGDSAIDQVYQSKLAALEAGKAISEKDIARLKGERDEARRLVTYYSQEFSKRPSSEINGIYREALQHFLNGDSDGALVLLNDDRLEKEGVQARQDLDIAQKKLATVVNSWVLKAQLQQSALDPQGALRSAREAVTLAPNSSNAWLSYATLLDYQNAFSESKDAYNKAIEILRKESSIEILSGTLQNLARAEVAIGQTLAASSNLNEALEISKSLLKTNSPKARRRVASVLNGIGVTYRQEYKETEAEAAFNEALTILQENNDPVDSDDLQATVLMNLGLIAADKKEFGRAKEKIEESVRRNEAILASEPGQDRETLGSSIYNLGLINTDLGLWKAALLCFRQSLSIFRDLHSKNQDRYSPPLVRVLSNLGRTLTTLRDFRGAHRALNEAEEIQRSLAKREPIAFLPVLAIVLERLGELYAAEGRTSDSNNKFEEATSIYKNLAEKNPTFDVDLQRLRLRETTH